MRQRKTNWKFVKAKFEIRRRIRWITYVHMYVQIHPNDEYSCDILELGTVNQSSVFFKSHSRLTEIRLTLKK